MNVRRDELDWADWSPARSPEQAGRRLALIVRTDAANANPRYPDTSVAAVRTSGRPVTTHVPLSLSAGNGLSAPSHVRCEQVITISKDRLLGRIGEIAPEAMAGVDAALRQALGLT